MKPFGVFRRHRQGPAAAPGLAGRIFDEIRIRSTHRFREPRTLGSARPTRAIYLLPSLVGSCDRFAVAAVSNCLFRTSYFVFRITISIILQLVCCFFSARSIFFFKSLFSSFKILASFFELSFFVRDPPKTIIIPWATGILLARWRPRAENAKVENVKITTINRNS